jgi:DNA-binding MarR family transcriptional regulator
MDALDLILVGRRLTKIGEEVMRAGTAGSPPAGPTLVMKDVLAHPGSSISAITRRTGLPQSYVSTSVARLSEKGMVETVADPADGRRTLVRPSPAHLRQVGKKAAVSADAELVRALGPVSETEAQATIDLLNHLLTVLVPSGPHPLRDG